MNRRTVAALNRINQAFYREQGAAFSRTRQEPWPGWERVVVLWRQLDEGHAAPSILDLGCGNGRFARFLAARMEGGFAYLGADASLVLLAEARSQRPDAGTGAARFVAVDLVLAGLDALAPVPPAGGFALVALFGLVHHIPGFEGRRLLLRRAARQLRRGGLLAASFWQFGTLARFQNRIIPWHEHNRWAEEPVDPAELEEGDVLLRWGEEEHRVRGVATGPRRYCHFADAAEVGALGEGLELAPVDTFRADGATGDLNLYLLLRKG